MLMGPMLYRTKLLHYRRDCRRGFSLLELLIALTILAIALVPVAYFYTKSLQMVEEASIRTRALMLCRERLAEIRQMPYDQIRTNVTPSQTQLVLYSSVGAIDTTASDWFGYDLELAGTTPLQWQAMFFYPLPLDYNPYQPDRQGYNNGLNVNHYISNNPIGGLVDSHVNFYDASGTPLDYEYEPIGFYKQKVYNANRALQGNIDGGLGSPAYDNIDIRMADRRTLTVIEPSIAGGDDYFRTGTEQQVDNYSTFGRRTIIMDVVPFPMDTDPANGADDYAPNDERDGGATAINPYPISKGPDNKFQLVSEYGTRGKMVTVQVFWLPRKAENVYIAWKDLNKVELKTFIAANNEASDLSANTGKLGRNDFLFISPPN